MDNSIKVETSSFRELFTDSNKIIYEVPFFQRGYVWGKDQWSNLHSKIREEVFKQTDKDDKDYLDRVELDIVKESKLFFGTIVLKKKPEGQNDSITRYNIIDGQQRFITIYVLCINLYKQLKNVEDKNQEPNEKSGRLREILYNKEDKNNNYNELKILSAQGGTLPIYKLLYGDNNTPNLPSGMYERDSILDRGDKDMIRQFYTYCDKHYLKPKNKETMLKWSDAILDSLQVACIYLPDNFDEQVIFETLNATGVELTTGELLCNYIFKTMEKSEEDKVSLHYEQWLRPQRELEKRGLLRL